MNNIPYVFNPMAISITIPVKDYSGVWVYVSNAVTGNPIASAMTMRNATIGSGQAGSGMKVLKDGVAERTSVTNLGKMYVLNGGTTNSATVISGGTMFVSSGGSGTSDRIFGGRAYVSNGGTLTDINVSGGAQVWVFNGGRINGGSAYTKDAASTGIASYTHIVVSNGGVVSGLHLYGSAPNNSGTTFLYVSNGGTISNCINEGTTNSGGRMYISAGGKAYDCITSTYYGYVYGSGHRLVTRGAGQWNVYNGASMTDVFMSGGVISGHSNCIISGGTIDSGTMHLWGSATNILVPKKGGALQLRDKIAGSGTTGNYAATGSATNLTIGPGASSFVSGGKLITATVQSGGIIYVRPGISNTVAPANQGRVEDIHVSGGQLSISGGIVSSSYVEGSGTANGTIYIYNGGIIDSCSAAFGPDANGTYNKYGYFCIYNGSGTNLTLNNGGVMQTYGSSGKISSSTINSGGIGNIYSCGSATYILVNQNGVLRAQGSGTNKAYISNCSTSISGGTFQINSGGVAIDIEAQKGKVLVNSAGIASNLNHYNPTATQATEQMIVAAGGTCNNIGQYGGGGGMVGLTISANAYVSGLTASSYSGTAPYTTTNGTIENFNYTSGWLYAGTSARVNSGTATKVTLFRANNGSIYNSMTLISGTFDVNAGGKASNTVLSQGGIMKINSAGAIDGATVSSGGSMVLLRGGTIVNYATVDIKSGGNVYISSGMTTNQLTGSGNIYVSTGAITTSTTVKTDGTLNILSGGKASSTIVSNGGKMIVSSRGAIDNATIETGGSMILLSGSTISNFGIGNVNYGGNLIISSTSFTFNEDIIGQNVTCTNATISDNVINAYDSPILYFNNTPIDTLYISDNDTYAFFSGGLCSYNNISAFYGPQVHCTNMSCNNPCWIENWAQLHVSSGAHISNIDLYEDGVVVVSSGGIAENINSNDSSGILLVKAGGSALNVDSTIPNITVENGGYITYATGGGGNNYDGYCVIYVSNTGSGTAISSDTYMADEAIGENCDGSGMVIYNNGYANTTNIFNGGIMHVSSGGYAEFTEINNGGSMIVSSGGSASYTSVNNGGTLIVKSGGYADEVGEYGGTLICEPGGTLIPE